MDELIISVKSLLNVISDDRDDYPDSQLYRMVQDRVKDVSAQIQRLVELSEDRLTTIQRWAKEAKALLNKGDVHAAKTNMEWIIKTCAEGK